MSAFIVGKDHIDALVGLTLYGPKDAESCWEGPRWAQGDPRVIPWNEQLWREVGATTGSSVSVVSPDECGAMLLAANIESIQARYPDTVAVLENAPGTIGEVERWAEDGPEAYEFDRLTKRYSAVAGLKLIDCFEYQACEYDGWEDSEAHRFCECLRGSLIGALPGYNDAPWGL